MKAAIQGDCFDLASVLRLGKLGLFHRYVLVSCVAVHQVVMTNESSIILVHQHQASILVRLAGFAASIQLRVSLEQTKQLVAIRNILPQQDSSTSRIADLLGQLDPVLNRGNLSESARGG